MNRPTHSGDSPLWITSTHSHATLVCAARLRSVFCVRASSPLRHLYILLPASTSPPSLPSLQLLLDFPLRSLPTPCVVLLMGARIQDLNRTTTIEVTLLIPRLCTADEVEPCSVAIQEFLPASLLPPSSALERCGNNAHRAVALLNTQARITRKPCVFLVDTYRAMYNSVTVGVSAFLQR
jgi:hypothetical protein